MANPKDKEFSTNPEVKRTDDFQDGVDLKEKVIEIAKELLNSTTEDAFSKLGFEKAEKKAGFYGNEKPYGAGAEQNKFGIRIAGVTKSSLEKQVMLGAKRMQSDINFDFQGKMVSVEYKTTEAGFFRGVDANSIPYTFIKTITVDGSKKTELQKAIKELFAEAAKKEVGYLTSTKLGIEDKLDKSTTSIVNENKQSMKKLTIKSIFSSEEDLFSSMNESKKENIKQIKDKNTTPLANVSPYDKGNKKAESGKFLLFDKNEKELNEKAENSPMGKEEYIKLVKEKMKTKFGTSNFKDLTPIEKKDLFNTIDKVYDSKKEKLGLNEEGIGVTASGPAGSGAGSYLTPNAFKKTVKETAYGKQKNNKRPKITQEYKAVPNTEGYNSDNFWQTVDIKHLQKNHIMGAPGMEGVEVNSAKELAIAKNGLKESVDTPKARLDLTKKKMFSTSENEAKGINKRYLVTEKTSDEYLKDRWKKLTSFKINESINENEELNDFLNESNFQEKTIIASKPQKESIKDLDETPVETKITNHLEETVTVQKPGSLFGLEYVFYKQDFLNESKKYILDLNSKVFVPNPNVK